LALIEFEAVEDQPAIVMPNNAALKQELEDLRVKLANYERDSASSRSENAELKAELAKVYGINREIEAKLQSLESKMFLKESSQIQEVEKRNSDLEEKLRKLTENYHEVVRKQEKQMVERQGEVNMPNFDKAEAKKIIEDWMKKIEKSHEYYRGKMESLKKKLENDSFLEESVAPQK